MNIVTQEAKKKQAIVKYAEKNGKSKASRKYGVSLSSVKRWCKKYDGAWQSLLDKSHRPHSHPSRHTSKEEQQIKNSFQKEYERYGWYGVYSDLLCKGYTRSFSGMVYAAYLSLILFLSKLGHIYLQRRQRELSTHFTNVL